MSLTIAGSDSGGGAGIQADLKTMEACGTLGTSAVTAVTAQNTTGVASSFVLPLEEIDAQIEAVVSDLNIDSVKTGMLATESVIDCVKDWAVDLQPLVVDPVMVAASGDRLLDHDAESAYESLIPQATLVTPNIDETEVLTDIAVQDKEDAVEAGNRLVDTGVDAALIKGGHLSGDEVTDVLVTPEAVEVFDHPRIDTAATHGSGCTLASAIAARLAHGDSISEAVEFSTQLLQRAVRYFVDVGEGPGAVHHLVSLREKASRTETIETVEAMLTELTRTDIAPLVPEVGMNVVGATPYAETPGEVAAVDGRITKTVDGVRPNRGVRCGASSHLARLLLAVREHDPTVRFAINLRFSEEIEQALETLDGPVVEIDRSNEPTPDIEGTTMEWLVGAAIEKANGTPSVIFDRGDVGKEAMTRILARDADTALERTVDILDQLDHE